jgi:hemoglobin-like flavoprotein
MEASMNIENVMESYRRVQNKGFAERFYQIFLPADPRFNSLFQKTDFARQKELLMHGIFSLLEYAQGSATGSLAIKRLGTLHSRNRMNISADMYPIWIDCLVKTVGELDPKFNRGLEKDWREAVQKGIDAMISVI